MTFGEFLRDLFDGAKTRLKKPFVSAYIIAVMLFNWEAVAVLFFSKEPIEKRLHYIHAEYLHWESYILYPLISTILFLTFSEYIMWFLEWLTIKGVEARDAIGHRKQMKQSERNTDLNEQRLREQESLEDYRERKELNKKIRNLEKALEKESIQKEAFNDELKELKKNLPKLEEENKALKFKNRAYKSTSVDSGVLNEYTTKIKSLEKQLDNQDIEILAFKENQDTISEQVMIHHIYAIYPSLDKVSKSLIKKSSLIVHKVKCGLETKDNILR